MLMCFYRDARNKDGLTSNCKECINNRSTAYRKNHLKESASYMNVWHKNNADKVNSWAAKRRASKYQATPSWLSDAQLGQIQEMYSLAKELQWLSEDKLEVDHIIPLQGENVSGLHVPWNLQILPKRVNISKGNRI